MSHECVDGCCASYVTDRPAYNAGKRDGATNTYKNPYHSNYLRIMYDKGFDDGARLASKEKMGGDNGY